MYLRKVIALLLCTSIVFTGIGITNNVSYATEEIEAEEQVQELDETEEVEQIETEEIETEEAEEETDGVFRGNSWRYSDGQLIQEYSKARDTYPYAWEKVDGNYMNSAGTVIEGAKLKGIDVSEWKEEIDGEKVKADGIDFAIIRCGWGMDYTSQDDKWWEYNVSECERLGIPYGVYLYSYATTIERASSEADHVLRLLKGHNPSLPVYYDMEDSSTISVGNEMLGKFAQTFCDKISAAGYKVGIYANLNWWNNYLTSSVFSNPSWSKWVAQYYYKCTYTGTYDMWQCTSSGNVDGIDGYADVNFWIGDTDTIGNGNKVEVSDTNIIKYSSHIQSYGWWSEVANGYQTGAAGSGKRMEALKINIGTGYADLGVSYSAHVQSYGWQSYVSNGAQAGTTGEAKAMQAVKIKLTGAASANYDIYYRVYSQDYGWLGWAKNGNPAGTQGYGKQMEGLQIAVVEKGAEAPGSTENAFVQKPLAVRYQSYVEDLGWQSAVTNGTLSGTTGMGKTLEALKVSVDNAAYEGGVKYDVYMQSYGWLGEKTNYTVNGLPDGNKRLEAVKISLTGELAENYDIYYRVHVRTFGWLDWAKNGEIAGTMDYAKRVEAIEIRLVAKGGAAPGATDVSYKKALLKYKAHVQTFGWQSNVVDGEIMGTTGLAKRLEAVQISLIDPNVSGGIEYRVHVQTYGWQNWRQSGEMAGTSGQAKRLEAIEIRLTGELAEKYDIYYRTHCQSYGWLGWAKNGEPSGTEGYAKRMEAMQIVLVEKGGTPPEGSGTAFVK